MPYCGWALLSAVWSANPTRTIQDALSLTLLCVGSGVVVHKLGVAAVARMILSTVCAVVIVSAALALFWPAVGLHSERDVIQSVHAGRWRGIFSHKNGLGPWACYASAFCIAFAPTLRISRPLTWAAAICGSLCLIFAGSSSSMAVLPVALAAGYLPVAWRRLSRGAFLICAVGCAIIAASTFAWSEGIVASALGRDPTLTGRTDIWRIAAKFAFSHPFSGAGYLTSGGPAFLDEVHKAYGQNLGSENLYIQSVLESGFVGLTLLISAVALGLWSGMNSALTAISRPDFAALRMLVAMVVTSLALGLTNADIFVPTGPIGSLNLIALTALLVSRRSPQVV